jgi:hypothetical protein
MFFMLQEGGVETLFRVCREASMEFAHSLALRGIATVCCVSESITELEKVCLIIQLSLFIELTYLDQLVYIQICLFDLQIHVAGVDHSSRMRLHNK